MDEFLSCSFTNSESLPDSSSRYDYATAHLDDAIGSSGASSSTIDAGAAGSSTIDAGAAATSPIIDVPDFDIVLDLTHEEQEKLKREGLAPKRKARYIPRPREDPPGQGRVLEPARSGVNGGRERRGRPGGQNSVYYAGLYAAKGRGKAAKRKYIEDFGSPPSKGGNKFHKRND